MGTRLALKPRSLIYSHEGRVHPETVKGPSETVISAHTGFPPGGLGWGSEKALARGLPGQGTSTAAACLSDPIRGAEAAKQAGAVTTNEQPRLFRRLSLEDCRVLSGPWALSAAPPRGPRARNAPAASPPPCSAPSPVRGPRSPAEPRGPSPVPDPGLLLCCPVADLSHLCPGR